MRKRDLVRFFAFSGQTVFDNFFAVTTSMDQTNDPVNVAHFLNLFLNINCLSMFVAVQCGPIDFVNFERYVSVSL